MIWRSEFEVRISAPEKTLTFKAKFVEIETILGHLVIFPNHAPTAFLMPENSKIFLEQSEGGQLILEVGTSNAFFSKEGTLIIIKNIF